MKRSAADNIESGTAADLYLYWKHLRVPFQLSLAPLFLWGYFLGNPSRGSSFSLISLTTFVVGFCSFHLFLYAGITAFNTAYDRDEGPVGGMLNPPPVPRYLLAFSLAV